MSNKTGIYRWKDWVFNQHNVICNQKYHGYIPYSFHLEVVEHTVMDEMEYNWPGIADNDALLLRFTALGHDLIEDARVSYNDIKFEVNECLRDGYGEQVAEMIFLCTEMRGRNRFERHSDQFYAELFENPYATYVKLCDNLANIRFSKLAGSNMQVAYKKEFPRIYKLMPEYIRSQFTNLDDKILKELDLDINTLKDYLTI